MGPFFLKKKKQGEKMTTANLEAALSLLKEKIRQQKEEEEEEDDDDTDVRTEKIREKKKLLYINTSVMGFFLKIPFVFFLTRMIRHMTRMIAKTMLIVALMYTLMLILQ